MKVESIHARTILNSGGKPAVEVEIRGTTGITAIASGPSAIAAGSREQVIGRRPAFDRKGADEVSRVLAARLVGRTFDQTTWDDELVRMRDFGTAVIVPTSIAFARLSALIAGVPLAVWIAHLSGRQRVANRPPKVLTALVSGGIHRSRGGPSVQQVMAVLDFDDPLDAAAKAVDCHAAVKQSLEQRGLYDGLGASSGLLATDLNSRQAIDMVSSALHGSERVTIALDVAAEHLRNPDGDYMLDGASLSPSELAEEVSDWIATSPVTYVEDPFHFEDIEQWKSSRSAWPAAVDLVGDDLYATSASHLDQTVANAVVLKINQVGTVSGTLETARHARELGIHSCVSHRSLETEDHFICHLAVGIDADYLKIGGPHRGDRTARYNELIRLAPVFGATV